MMLNNMPDLRFVSDLNKGITRQRYRNKFHYIDINGQRVTDEFEIQRIKSLAIPPAWTNVWICANEKGHIQATGRDAKLRKQYRYHTLWRQTRDQEKYEHMIGFGNALPIIRKNVSEALSLPGLPQEKILATIIYLLQLTMIRIGNDEYVKQNKSYGLTTLRNKHIQVNGSKIQFQFRGKSGVDHNITISNLRLARIVKKIRDLPGQELFQYVDDEGHHHSINSSDVNDYIRQVTGENYTAKDFRTWYGTLNVAQELIKLDHFTSETEAKKNVVEVIKSVAKKLGNTPAICRKCYVHPSIISSYLDGKLVTMLPKLINKNEAKLKALENLSPDSTIIELSVEEKAILEFLQKMNHSAAKSSTGS